MTNNVKVSVIVPCYNAEKFLPKCMKSLQSQTLSEIEIICVNDCSKDTTKELLNEYAQKDARVKPIHFDKNQGQSSARNAGIKIAKGEFISFVDSDDYIEQTMLEKLYNKAKDTQSDMVISNIYLDFEDTGEKQLFRDNRYYTFLSGRTFKPTEHPPLISCIGVWDRIYKRELIIDNNLLFPVGLVYEDHLFCIQAYILANKVTVVNEPLYYYRKNAGGSITDNEKKNDNYKFNFLEISRRIKKFLREKKVYEIFQKEYLKYHFFYAMVHQHYITDKEKFKKFFEEMYDLTSENDYEVLNALNHEYLAEHYLESLQENNWKSFYSMTKSVSIGKSLLNVFKPKGKRK